MSSLETLLNTLDTPLDNALNSPMVARVKPGDTLSQLVCEFYGVSYASKGYQMALAQIRRHNPWITDINRIRPGQLVKLLPLPTASVIKDVELPLAFKPFDVPSMDRCYACAPKHANPYQVLETHMPEDETESYIYQSLAWFEESWPSMALNSGSAAATGLGVLTGDRNQALVRHVAMMYQQYVQGKITKGQYDYARKKSLDTLKNKLGPSERILYRGKTTHEAIRIRRTGAVRATDYVVQNADRLKTVAKWASRGGLLLTALSLYKATEEICATSDVQAQNETFVEAIGGVAGGAGAALLTAALVTTPVGWVAALGIGIASAVAGVVTGKTLRFGYDRFGNKVDLVGASGVRKLC